MSCGRSIAVEVIFRVNVGLKKCYLEILGGWSLGGGEYSNSSGIATLLQYQCLLSISSIENMSESKYSSC